MSRTPTMKPSKASDIFNFDIDNIMIPDEASAYYKLVEYFFTYSIVGEAITKKAEFIIAGLKIDSESAEGVEYGKKIVRKTDLKNKLVRMAINYFAFGLSALYPLPKVRKTLQCKSCAHTYALEKLTKEYKPLYSYTDKGEYRFKCTQKDCKSKGMERPFKLIEEEVNDISEYNFAVWPPQQLSAIYNSVTDSKMWMYKCDDHIRKLLSDRDHYT
ncbi:MAG: hypothetical protein Q8M92_08360, partial [Candidatus Subteraquimicrobiales bacterium]|nr:hypothetical protein [Candidatus Subteraquimicrobiales bacterium]